MNTKNRIFSKEFCLTEQEGKYGTNDKNGKTILYPVYDSIWELDSFDFIIEQDGKFGYADFNEQNETELLLPLYDVIIKKEHGLSLIKRGELDEEIKTVCGEQRLWYDTKSHTLHPNMMHIRSFKEHDLFISTKNVTTKSPHSLKNGEKIHILKYPIM